ncbi:diguanylate cyclase [Desulfuribacillus alkaliarsenatis]|uniref:Diguanylate cyclase n=1 Tax=Desulfuribacillus alkaliarsenatis TaxID=766136 RepID=A0A1E5G343_9FIRM|nr:diguanylate cyclase [Desulfuribacillus alkaliarsenatis]OEF97495.1 hypothetical protein BHF68_04625 [Desulfuribacillus alkaliarsenatis]
MELILTDHERCVNCNKCINVCPTEFANTVVSYKGKLVHSVNHDLCIGCGECVIACNHNARDYIDDTERFFSDLAKGEKISLTVAPSAKFNIPNLYRLFGFLKAKGVRLIYDVSLGADITTWAYIKELTELNLETVIAQPCPVVVNYIEKYKPELIDQLAAIQSPLMCTVTYLKEYKKINDSIAFLSPCIAKLTEIRDANTNNMVQYNVTFKKLTSYLEKYQVNLSEYEEIHFDDIDAGLGVVFSKPGGLRENVEYHKPGAWIRQIEGARHLYKYLDHYSVRLKKNKQAPLLVDCLNCVDGCNIGTGTEKAIPIDDIDVQIKAIKKMHLEKWEEPTTSGKPKYNLFNKFDQELKLDSFKRSYTDKSDLVKVTEPTPEQLDTVFKSMYKMHEKSRKVNCYSCGYQSCTSFAKAVFNGYTQKENCFRYNLEISRLEHEENEIVYGEIQRLNELLEQKVIERTEELEIVNARLEELLRIDALTEIPNRKAFDEQLEREWNRSIREQEPLSLMMLDIDCFKQYNDNYGHIQGDLCLKNIASALVSSLLRTTDFVARYGGEEFIILLPNTDKKGAITKANTVLKQIANLRLKHDYSVVTDYVTVSIGVNTIVASALDSSEDFIKDADLAMYQAKANGRNSVFHINEQK